MSNESNIKTALLCAMLAKSSLDMLGHHDALVVRLQLQQVAKDFKALADHVAALPKEPK